MNMNYVGVCGDIGEEIQKAIGCVQCRKTIYIWFKHNAVINFNIFKTQCFRFLPEKIEKCINK